MKPYNPTEPTQLWCDHCDQVVVHSQEPETGKFFTQFGAPYNRAKKGFDLDDYTSILISVCHLCLKQEEV
jgi:hypothetical protein